MRVLIVTNMYPTADRPVSGTFVKEQVEALREAGVDIDVLTIDGESGMTSYLRAASSLRRILRQRSYDLLHAHYGLSGLAARLQIGHPVIVTFHGSDLSPPVGARGRTSPLGTATWLISNLIALTATQTIVVADVLRPKLWIKSAVTIPMGVDLALFRPMPRHKAREQVGFDQDTCRVAFVADPNRFLKRIDLAREAVQLLQQSGTDVQLVTVYGQPHQLVPVYMNACDVLVLTSTQEASPCVVKEALACNLPVVSTNVGDVAERIAGVEGCYLCEPTPADIAAKLRQALEFGGRTSGRDKVQDLSLQNIAQRVIAVYQLILARRDRNPLTTGETRNPLRTGGEQT